MSSPAERLREILTDPTVIDSERGSYRRSEILTLMKHADPKTSTGGLDLDVTVLEALASYCDPSDTQVLAETFALLRNVVPFDEGLRRDLAASTFNQTVFAKVFEYPLTIYSDSHRILVYLRFLQYCANFVAADPETSETFFSCLVLSEKQPLLLVLRCKLNKTASVAVAVLRRLLLNETNWARFLQSEDFVEFIEILIERTITESDLDAMDIAKKCLTSSELFIEHFDKFDLSSRCFLLDLLAEQLSKTNPELPRIALPQESLDFCKAKVKAHIESLRKTNYQNATDTSGVLFVKYLTILASASLNKENGVSDDIELLVMCIECLRTVHNLGKQKVAGLDQKIDFDSLAGDSDEIYDHPLFGLKKDLVRLIGNICYKNKLNQDTVRDFDGVELLCDMSSLDARNPYITQWVVLALKHLMDGNEANQKIVASLTKKTSE